MSERIDSRVLLEARERIATFFTERRLELGLTQADLAERTGLGLSTIKRFEAANFWPVLKQYIIICEALHLFPLVATYEGDNEFSRMMRDNWKPDTGKDMTIEEALEMKKNRFNPDHHN